jgi:flagellar basal body-associated protein FliL
MQIDLKKPSIKYTEMKKKNRTWIIVIVVLALVVISAIRWGIRTYNGFITMEEGIEGQWANVETSYQRRADLIPNLVNTVRGVRRFRAGNPHPGHRSQGPGHQCDHRSHQPDP